MDPSPYKSSFNDDDDEDDGVVVAFFCCGTPPDKLFRWRNIDEREERKSEGGMVPLNRFMLMSRYTNSESDSSPMSGPHMRFPDADK